MLFRMGDGFQQDPNSIVYCGLLIYIFIVQTSNPSSITVVSLQKCVGESLS